MRSAGSVFVAFSILALAITSYFAFASTAPLAFWSLALAPPVLLGGLGLAWGVREGLARRWLTPRWGDFTRGIVGAAGLYALAWAFVRLIAPVGSPREIWLVSVYGQIGNPQVLRAQAPLVAGTILFVSACEEIVWRGAVPEILAERFGSRRAWVASALLYGAAYAPTLWSLRAGSTLNPVIVVAALGGGLVWGAMARGFGSLVPSIVAHAFFDWIVVMMVPLWGGRFDL
jgi:membrane protease YdiL (CAAX protease family)